jgi:hypothetical protein
VAEEGVRGCNRKGREGEWWPAQSKRKRTDQKIRVCLFWRTVGDLGVKLTVGSNENGAAREACFE